MPTQQMEKRPKPAASAAATQERDSVSVAHIVIAKGKVGELKEEHKDIKGQGPAKSLLPGKGNILPKGDDALAPIGLQILGIHAGFGSQFCIGRQLAVGCTHSFRRYYLS